MNYSLRFSLLLKQHKPADRTDRILRIVKKRLNLQGFSLRYGIKRSWEILWLLRNSGLR